jgi:hypothetical protein
MHPADYLDELAAELNQPVRKWYKFDTQPKFRPGQSNPKSRTVAINPLSRPRSRRSIMPFSHRLPNAAFSLALRRSRVESRRAGAVLSGRRFGGAISFCSTTTSWLQYR